MLGYIYGKILVRTIFSLTKIDFFVEFLKNINKPLLFKTFIKNIVEKIILVTGAQDLLDIT